MNQALVFGAISFVILAALFYLASYFYLVAKNYRKDIQREREESTRHLYELAILKELGERTGYSLNIEEILQVITGSLRQFIDYTAVGYVVVSPEKLKVHTHLDTPVNRAFLQDMKNRMLASIEALTGQDFKNISIEEMFSGAILIEEMVQTIGSIFNIPIVINGEVAGVLSVAHTKAGLYKEADMSILYKIVAQASEAVSRLKEVVKMEKGKLNSMVLSMGDGVLMVDNEYRVMVANPAIKKIVRVENDKDITIFDFVDALGGKFDIHGRLEEALVNKKSFVSERIKINDSFFEIGVYPVLHSVKGANQVLGGVAVFHDVTKDIELERVREEFTSMIVHELRSPLDGIKKIFELMVAGKISPDSKEFKEYLNMAHQSSSSMLELVNDILDLSKLQAGKFEVRREMASVQELIENRLLFYKISADTRKVTLQSYFDASLPKMIEFDPQATKQILNNLISNALKFTSEGGRIIVSAFLVTKGGALPNDLNKNNYPVLPEIEKLDIKTNSLCIMVSDTGIGIPADNLKDLFHTYKQAKLSPVRADEKGTGLGLVIVRGITEAHGGQVGVVSREGVGSTFFFTVPLEDKI